jgi:ribonucleoside-diphosphate reductase alpha chain
MMDCDTTGIEPDLGLVKMKKLVGGGRCRSSTRPCRGRCDGSATRAQRRRDRRLHRRAQVDPRAPAPRREHLPVFACSMGDNTIHYSGHVRMMGACSRSSRGHLQDGEHARGGRPSKRSSSSTSTREGSASRPSPSTATTAEVASRWPRRRRRAQAPTRRRRRPAGVERIVERVVQSRSPEAAPHPRSRTFEFRVADCKGFVTVGEYDDGRPARSSSGLEAGLHPRRIMDAFAISSATACSTACRCGLPSRRFTNMRFEPPA